MFVWKCKKHHRLRTVFFPGYPSIKLFALPLQWINEPWDDWISFGHVADKQAETVVRLCRKERKEIPTQKQ